MAETMTNRNDRKRVAVLAAARVAFLRDGFRGASMDAVAIEAGVSKQTVYAHFGSKEKLYLLTVAEITQHIAAQLPEPPLGDINREGLATWLVDYGTRQLHAVLSPEIVQLRRLVIAEAGRFPDIAQAFHDNGVQRSIDLLATALKPVASSGVLHIDDSRVAASDLNWLLMGEPINRAMMLSSTPSPEAVRAHVEHAVTVFLAAYS